MRGSSGRASAGRPGRGLLAASRLSAALERGSLDQTDGGCLAVPPPLGTAAPASGAMGAADSTSPASSSKLTRRPRFKKVPPSTSQP